MDAADECVTSVLRADSLISRCCCVRGGRRGSLSPRRQRCSLSSAAPSAAAAAAAAAQPSFPPPPPTLDGNSLVGSFYGLRARSAAVDQSRQQRVAMEG